ncbi:MAG: RagB/SusD family nutrient uptake outer membrane protein [Bacteroidaceae bacterium]|nr:RagB/SusD family nutrient uptake outer membrane protein [Bacteroidaceae bacterium]
MKKYIYRLSLSVAAACMLSGFNSCNKFLDVVPDDGLATIETAFNLRSTAIRYLATCYAYMPNDGIPGGDPAILGGDETWDLIGRVVTNTSARVPQTNFNIARGYMTATSVYANDWVSMYQGIRCCDILCQNVDAVPDMDTWEKNQWKSEAKFLKAYYHFELVRKWGPVPIIRESLPIDAETDQVRVFRDNIDDCFDFILALLDEAMTNLPAKNISSDEYGRITKPICAAFKAKVATYAASPLFNGNVQEASLVDSRGTSLFPAKTDEDKRQRWVYAMNACERAIKICDSLGFKMIDGKYVKDNYQIVMHGATANDTLVTELALRTSFYSKGTIENINENIWPNTQSSSESIRMFQQLIMPNFSEYAQALGGYRFLSVPLKIAEQFYTRNGLPINNDLEWVGKDVFELKAAQPSDAYYLLEGYTTIALNFDREPRFYASLGFDGGTWLSRMPTVTTNLKSDDMNVVKCRLNGPHGKTSTETGPVTGYFPKKYCPYECIFTAANTFSYYWFPWPIIRYTDLLLLYCECINEAEGPDGPHSKELFEYLDKIRERAGIPDVKTSWDMYSNNPGYYSTQAGMRAIIQNERLNELAFESQRFWDIRRWMTAPAEYQKGIYGFNIMASSPEDYYVKSFVANQDFGLKDYFWPIPTSYIEVNPNLVQNIGW